MDGATAKRDLRTGTSVWDGTARTVRARARALTGSLKVDVAIVGAGVSGAFMAHALSQQFERVTVFDRRPPAHGSTMASTCMLQFEIDTPLIELSDQIGTAKAKRAWLRSFRATQELQRLVEDEGIRCGLQAREALYLSGDRLGHRALAQEHRRRRRVGLPGEYLKPADLRARFGIDREGAILSTGNASANPVQLSAGLLRRAARNGATLFSPVEIRDVMATTHGVVLDTGSHFVEAKHCVFCTGYELLKGVPRSGAKIISSWAVASRPQAHYPAWLDHMMIWEASDPYLYLRTTPDGRILAGGEDEETDSPGRRADVLAAKAERLMRKVRKLLGGVEFTASKRWAGAFGDSKDGLPVIDAVPGMPNCHVVMGVGGNGTIYSFIASQIIARALTGHPDADRDLYRFR